MNKDELSKALVWHLNVKLNIIAAILNTIPKYDIKTKKIVHQSFCSFRLFNLTNLKFCIPENLRKSKLKPKELIRELIKHIHKNNKECDNVWKLDSNHRNKLETNNSNFSKIYRKRIQNLEKRHKEHLLKLINILNQLKDHDLFSNAQLYEVARETKRVLDSLHIMCENEYVLLILNLIYDNMNVNNRIDENIKREMNLFLKSN